MKRLLPAYPLWIVDPLFSVWSPSDELAAADTQFWTGKEKKAYGFVRYGEKTYCFMGRMEGAEPLVQTDVRVSAFATEYDFTAEAFELKVRFVSPLLPDDLQLMSCPVCYTEYEIREKGAPQAFSVAVALDEGFCYDEEAEVIGGVVPEEGYEAAFFTRRRNLPMSHANDMISPDWGTAYLAGEEGWFLSRSGLNGYLGTGSAEYVKKAEERKYILAVSRKKKGYFMTAFDDGVSISYFGEWLKNYFFKDGKTVFDALRFSAAEKESVLRRLSAFDEKLKADCDGVGDGYYLLACAALRQSVGAHKLVENRKGELLFLSKECNSNGCIGTADITYPSMPLYLLYNPELVNGMLRGIFDFARMDVWTFDFAPHDIGTYPYCCGQVYGVSGRDDKYACGSLNAPDTVARTHLGLYMFPAKSDVYEFKYQMPVEECGNMIVATAAAAVAKKDFSLAEKNFDLLEKWVTYLEKYGLKPESQLCTDDFAGHLANNVNLAVKAVVGIESFALICENLGRKEAAEKYYALAKDYAARLRAETGAGVLPLAYGQKGSYSIKYNMLFDKLFGFSLFSREVCEEETSYYVSKNNAFGVPLDVRADYTKSDWILWAAAMTDDKQKRAALYAPVLKFLKESPRRAPFGDWYHTTDGKIVYFINRTVQGGVFAPLLAAKELLKTK